MKPPPTSHRFLPGYAWYVGGLLLLAPVILGYGQALLALSGIFGSVVGTALTSAAFLAFAFGLRGWGSVTGRRQLGTTALTALATWLLVAALVHKSVVWSNYDGDSLLAFSLIAKFVEFALALIVVTQIARIGIVPRPWNWAPAWAMGAVTLSWLVQEAAARVFQDGSYIPSIVGSLDGLVRVSATVFLGVLAIVLADRARRNDSVPAPAALTTTERQGRN